MATSEPLHWSDAADDTSLLAGWPALARWIEDLPETGQEESPTASCEKPSTLQRQEHVQSREDNARAQYPSLLDLPFGSDEIARRLYRDDGVSTRGALIRDGRKVRRRLSTLAQCRLHGPRG